MKKRYSIGRNPDNTFRFPDQQSVSGLHAYLTLISENELLVEDNNSTNGTFVNDLMVFAWSMNRSDELRLGSVRIMAKGLFEQLASLEYTHVRSEAEKPKSGPSVPDVSGKFAELKDVFDNYRRSKREIAELREGNVLDKILRTVGPLGVFLKTNGTDFLRMQEELDDWFQEKYACPHCKSFFGNVKWDLLAQRKSCRSCRAILVK